MLSFADLRCDRQERPDGDLLEVHFRVLGEGNVRAQVVVQAMVGLVVLQQLNDLASPQLLCVLLSHLHDQLQVLLHVGLQQLLQHTDRHALMGQHVNFAVTSA